VNRIFTAIKRLFLAMSLVLVYLIGKELVLLNRLLFAVHPLLGYGFLLCTGLFVVWFILLPLLKIITLPKFPGPAKQSSEESLVMQKRLKLFAKNPYLKEQAFVVDPAKSVQDNYAEAIRLLDLKLSEIKETYLVRTFISVSVSQNGFIDAIIVFSAGVNLVREIFVLFHGRSSIRDLLIIGRHLYYSIAISGSEVIEQGSEELFSKLSTDGIKNIPLLGKLVSSAVDGFISAILLSRVALLTANYCNVTRIEKDKDLYPTGKAILETARHLTRQPVAKTREAILSLDDIKSAANWVANPMLFVFGRTRDFVVDKGEVIGSHGKGLLQRLFKKR
jgi:hypothetical protein